MSQEKTTKQQGRKQETSSMPSSSSQQSSNQELQRYPSFSNTTTQHSDAAEAHSNQHQRSNIPRLFHQTGRQDVPSNLSSSFSTFHLSAPPNAAALPSAPASSSSSVTPSTPSSSNTTELSVHLKPVKVEKMGSCFKMKMSPIISTNNPDALRSIVQALSKRSTKSKKGVKKQEKMGRGQAPSPSSSASSSSSTMPLAPSNARTYLPPSPTGSSSTTTSFSFFEPHHISPAASQTSSPSPNNASPYTSPAISPRMSPRTMEHHSLHLQPHPPQYQLHQLQYPQYIQQPPSPTLAHLNMQFQHLHTSNPNATSPRGSNEQQPMVHSSLFPLPNAQFNPVYVGSSADSSPAPQEHQPPRFTPHTRSDSSTSTSSTASSGSNASTNSSPRGSLSEEDRRRAEAKRKRISISSLCNDDSET